MGVICVLLLLSFVGVAAAIGGTIPAVILALLLRMFGIEAFKIPSGSMIPTLQVGDHIFVNKAIYRFHPPERGDVAVFIYPREQDKDFIKRVIAVANDTIEIRDHVLYVNDVAVPREHVSGDCHYEDFTETSWETVACDAWLESDKKYEVVYGTNDRWPNNHARERVPAGQAFVLGDNRDNSLDSRMFGFVPYDYFKGRAMFVWWSIGASPRWSRLGHSIE
jgi:signal peptidase I